MTTSNLFYFHPSCGRWLSGACLLVACAGLLNAPVVKAQGHALEEIIVTAQKRQQNIQNVGIAIDSFSGAQMNSLDIQQSFDISDFSPGVFQSGNIAGQNTQFTIRGVTQNDFNDIIEAPTAAYLDEGYIAVANAQTFTTFDIDRVDILKGPQGTLFGRNATGGLVQYHTRKPDFKGPEGYANFTYGAFDSDANANQYRVQAAYGSPLTQTLAGRVAVSYIDSGGYLNNKYPGLKGVINGQSFFTGMGSDAPGPGAGADMGGHTDYGVRGSVLYEPSGDFSFFGMFNYSKSDMSTGPYQSKPTIAVLKQDPTLPAGQQLVVVNTLDVAPNETRASINQSAGGADGGSDQANTGSFTNTGPRPVPGGDFFGYIDPDGPSFNTTSGDFAFKNQDHTKSWGLNGKVQWTLPNGIQMTYVGDYKKYNKILFIDVDSAPVNQLANMAGDNAWDVTQELRFNGTTDKSNWVGGFYYLHIDNHSKNGLKAPANSLPAFFGFGNFPTDIGVKAHLITDSYNLYGQVEYRLTDQLTATVGARVIQEEKNYNMLQGLFASQSVFTADVGNPYVTLNTFSDKTSKTLWAGTVRLGWRPTDDLLLYAGVRRGVKAGSFNAPIPGGRGFSNSALPYKAEILYDYEGGFKSTLFNGTTRINGSVYYYQYDNYQAFLFTGVAGIVLNRNQRTVGGELTIQTSPFKGLNLQLGVSGIHARVKHLPLLIGSSLPSRNVRPVYTPDVTVSGLVRYEWPMFTGMMNAQVDFSLSSDFYYNLRQFTADKFGGYRLVNGELGWTSGDGHWHAKFMVNNIANDLAGVQGFDLSTLCGCNEISFRPPRWYGFQVGYSL